MQDEICIPHPEHLIKSIAEQGYTLETSIADLIDNSLSADAERIEVLVDTQQTPFRLFIADDGNGMTAAELKKSMHFPSSSMEEERAAGNLGRFGLGLKTASFAQTRSFTVISKKPTDTQYHARTWDVEHLKKTGSWSVIINTTADINEYLLLYQQLSQGFLNPFPDYQPNTIIVWHHLYKFQEESAATDQSELLQKELSDVTKEYLQLIFHRFLERENPVKIRLNNEQLKPFNPFPARARCIAAQQKTLVKDKVVLEGFVLPNRSLEESKGVSEWTLTHKSLMDMEGIYIYRADRIIVYGGWNGIIKKSPRLQLARLRVEIGNGADSLFHLNVAKSSIIIPFTERVAFMRYVSELRTEAEKEYYNHTTKATPTARTPTEIFRKIPTSKGMMLATDYNFPLLKMLTDTLSEDQQKKLKVILRMITTSVNKIRKVHSDSPFADVCQDEGVSEADIAITVNALLAGGMSRKHILQAIFPAMGVDPGTLPPPILSLLKQ